MWWVVGSSPAEALLSAMNGRGEGMIWKVLAGIGAIAVAVVAANAVAYAVTARASAEIQE